MLNVLKFLGHWLSMVLFFTAVAAAIGFVLTGLVYLVMGIFFLIGTVAGTSVPLGFILNLGGIGMVIGLILGPFYASDAMDHRR